MSSTWPMWLPRSMPSRNTEMMNMPRRTRCGEDLAPAPRMRGPRRDLRVALHLGVDHVGPCPLTASHSGAGPSTRSPYRRSASARFCGVVDDRLGVAGWPPARGGGRRRAGQFGHPPPHVVAPRVKLLALRGRAEHPEVRCGVGARPGGPPPADAGCWPRRRRPAAPDQPAPSTATGVDP